MSGKTKIEWADRVWNPVVGCTPVSAGCAHCYAKRMYDRFYQGKPFSEVQLHPERLGDPEKWKAPARVFVNSMSDLFHEDVPDDFIVKVWEAMRLSTRHTFMVLTKRPERLLEFSQKYYYVGYTEKNIWLGVSVEDQKTADERIPLLLQTPAVLRFVSVEPMLGEVDLEYPGYLESGNETDDIGCFHVSPALDWIICGGESGPGARPMHLDWARSLRDQCVSAGVPFLFKQWGEWAPVDFEANVSHSIVSNGVRMGRVGKQTAGRYLDGREWNEFPEER